jgi:hypothetical protein
LNKSLRSEKASHEIAHPSIKVIYRLALENSNKEALQVKVAGSRLTLGSAHRFKTVKGDKAKWFEKKMQ